MKQRKHLLFGRYGMDQLNIALLSITFLLEIIALMCKNDDLKLICCLIFMITIYRMVSKKHIQRYKENVWFIKRVSPIIKVIYIKKARTKDKEHKYCHCPSCHQTIRIEKQREKITVSCPICKSEFIK